tara:strand:+ start:100 stop:363 length:264 start_codon:yes stop_codon:yes gene_type:complete
MELLMVPYDPWFDPNYKYDPDKLDDYGRPPNPLDSMPIATDKPKNKSVEESNAELSLHEKAYRLARSKYNPFSVGGSENIHDFDRKD